jgi:hypothetical protein
LLFFSPLKTCIWHISSRNSFRIDSMKLLLSLLKFTLRCNMDTDSTKMSCVATVYQICTLWRLSFSFYKYPGRCFHFTDKMR